MLFFSRKALVTILITLLVLAAGYGDFRPSNVDLTISSYKYNLLRWELSHFMEKWVRQAWNLLPWTPGVDRI